MRAETLTVLRGDTDKYGNSDKAEQGTVEGLFAWGPGVTTTRARADGGKRESALLQVELYVKRGSDIKVRDRVKRAGGQLFKVLAGPAWDNDAPHSGHDFGWVVFQVEQITSSNN